MGASDDGAIGAVGAAVAVAWLGDGATGAEEAAGAVGAIAALPAKTSGVVLNIKKPAARIGMKVFVFTLSPFSPLRH